MRCLYYTYASFSLIVFPHKKCRDLEYVAAQTSISNVVHGKRSIFLSNRAGEFRFGRIRRNRTNRFRTNTKSSHNQSECMFISYCPNAPQRKQRKVTYP